MNSGNSVALETLPLCPTAGLRRSARKRATVDRIVTKLTNGKAVPPIGQSPTLASHQDDILEPSKRPRKPSPVSSPTTQLIPVAFREKSQRKKIVLSGSQRVPSPPSKPVDKTEAVIDEVIKKEAQNASAVANVLEDDEGEKLLKIAEDMTPPHFHVKTQKLVPPVTTAMPPASVANNFLALLSSGLLPSGAAITGSRDTRGDGTGAMPNPAETVALLSPYISSLLGSAAATAASPLHNIDPLGGGGMGAIPPPAPLARPVTPNTPGSSTGSSSGEALLTSSKTKQILATTYATSGRRNYKNLTMERRLEANARERNRVHTIGSSFEGLRRIVPSFLPDQKLSKLSILRITCKYILFLGALNGIDFTEDQKGYTVAQCAAMLNDTICREQGRKFFINPSPPAAKVNDVYTKMNGT